MAIKFEHVTEQKKNFDESPLTLLELEVVTEAEEYIDSMIIDSLEKGFSRYQPIRIFLGVINFTYSMKTNMKLNIPDSRRIKMRIELERRYSEAGWEYSIDTCDEPNMGADYWVLTGKQQL